MSGVFVCGDWNAYPDSQVVAELGTFLTVISPTAGNTFHGSLPSLDEDSHWCIDYIAVDAAHADRVRVLHGATVPDTAASDHKPVCVRVSLADLPT